MALMKFIVMLSQNWNLRSTPNVYLSVRYDSLVSQDGILRLIALTCVTLVARMMCFGRE